MDQYNDDVTPHDNSGNELTVAEVLAAVGRFVEACEFPDGFPPKQGDTVLMDVTLLPVEFQHEAVGILNKAIKGRWPALRRHE